MSQITIIQEAKILFIVPLNDAETRFSVYVQGRGIKTLSVLWPTEDDKPDLLERQVASNLAKFPLYHFYLPKGESGCPYHKLGKIFREINPDIQVFRLRGHDPSDVFA